MAARLTAIAAAAACAAAAVALARDVGAEARPGYGGEIVATLTGEPVSLDPVAARSHAELTVTALVFDTLYRAHPDGTIVPHLAAAMPEAQADGTVRIALRDHVTFHDGSALDAGDVVASLRRLGKSAAGWIVAPLAAIARDGDAVVVTPRATTTPVAALLAAPQAAVTPDGAAPKAKAPVGSGPFRVEAIDRGKRRIVLVASEAHVRGRPYLDRVELRWFAARADEARGFEEGKLHVSARGATTVAGASPKYKAGVVEGPATILTFVGFGAAHPDVTGSVELRRALALAIARGGLASVGSGERVEPTDDPVPVDLGGPSLGQDARGADLAAASKALDRAAAKVPALAEDARARLTLEILVDKTRFDDRDAADKVVVALDKLGIAATVTELGAAEHARRVADGECDLWIGQLPAAGAEPALLWGAAFAAGGDGWAKAELAAGALDPAAARAAFARRLPVIPLFHRALRVHHRTDVRGVALDAAGRIGLADLYLWGAPARSKGRR